MVEAISKWCKKKKNCDAYNIRPQINLDFVDNNKLMFMAI